MHAVKLSPGNIWSGNRMLAVFTNPTEIAFRKGNLKRNWPVRFQGTDYSDAETAYKKFKRVCHSFEGLQNGMVDIISCKLCQHPVQQCSHLVFPGCQNRLGRWEGWELESAFIRCLHRAFEQVTSEGGDTDA